MTQNNIDVFRINNGGDTSMSPLIGFKMCTLKITLIKKISLNEDVSNDCIEFIENFETPQTSCQPTIDSCLSLSEKLLPGEDVFIDRCLSLSDRLHDYGEEIGDKRKQLLDCTDGIDGWELNKGFD